MQLLFKYVVCSTAKIHLDSGSLVQNQSCQFLFLNCKAEFPLCVNSIWTLHIPAILNYVVTFIHRQECILDLLCCALMYTPLHLFLPFSTVFKSELQQHMAFYKSLCFIYLLMR